jgi:hypothetical protein
LFTLAKFVHDNANDIAMRYHLPYLAWRRERDGIISIFCHAAQGGQGKKIVTVTVAVFITLNFSNVNTAL